MISLAPGKAAVPLEAPPKSFAALMELYEINYLFMRRLMPRPFEEGVRLDSTAGATPLYLRVLDRGPYTTTVELTHLFEGSAGEGVDVLPDLTVRVYHDARVAEVLCVSGKSLRGGGESLATRWSVNRFLNRWLRFCLGEGHCFADPQYPGKAVT